MRYLQYSSPFGLSGKRLASALGLQASKHPPTGATICVSWGSPHAPAEALNGGIRVGKLFQLETWKSADLSTLTFSRSPERGWLPRSGRSFGGRDFGGALAYSRYWTKPVENVIAEFRVHVIRKPNTSGCSPAKFSVVRLGQKVNVDPSLNREVGGVQIRSRQFGWHLKYFGPSMRQTLTSLGDLDLQCRWALSSLGWDFGAIDVLQTEQGFVLLEANSAPALKDDATLKAYADRIKEIIGE